MGRVLLAKRQAELQQGLAQLELQRQQLMRDLEATTANLNATRGALQLLEELLKEPEPKDETGGPGDSSEQKPE